MVGREEDLKDVLRELLPKDKGNYLIMKCPSCGEREAYVYKEGLVIQCNRKNKCDYSETINDYKKRVGIGIGSNRIIKRKIERKEEKEEKEEKEKEEKEGEIVGIMSLNKYFQSRLKEREEGRKYLEGRKYGEEEILKMGLGFCDSLKGVEDFIEGENLGREEKERLKLLVSDNRILNRITIPFIDIDGKIKGYIYRGVRDEQKPKYLNSKGIKLSESFFNEHEVRGEKELVIMEGAIDALISSVRGLRGVVGLGRGIVSEEQIRRARERGVNSYTLMLDNDEAGKRGIINSLRKLLSVTKEVKICRYDIEYKDPDEFLRNKTIKDLEIVVRGAKSYVEWLKEEYKSEGTKIELKEKIRELMENDNRKELEELEKEMGVKEIILPYTFSDLLRDVKRRKEGLRIGIRSIDKILQIPEGAITVIAGRPSHGKTTFMLNIFLNMVRDNTDKKFIFFTYEETEEQIGLKCLNIICDLELDQYRNTEAIMNYLRMNREDIRELERGKETFSNLTREGRLWLVGEAYYIDDLVLVIENLVLRNKNIGGIFIDYIQKIKIRERYQTRQVEIQKISEKLLECAKKLRIRIIVGAQLNREVKDSRHVTLSSLRESGDIEQDANVVLSVYNESVSKQEEKEEEEEARKMVDLEVRVLKNRNGVSGKRVVLKFVRPTLKIVDKEGDENKASGGEEWGY